MQAQQGIKSVEFEGLVFRNGTSADNCDSVEDLGQMSYWHQNPLMRLKNNLRQYIRKLNG